MNCIILKNKICEITNGYNNNHLAVDIVAKNYTVDDVVAHCDGEIVELQDGYLNMKGSTGILSYGNYLKINHGNGFQTLYAHLGKGINFNVGDTVKKGEFLGYMSDSGNAYGKHLHFEVIKDNIRINPTDYLNNDFLVNNDTRVKYKIGDKVKINGVYVSSVSDDKLIPLINYGVITKIINGAKNPYLLNDGSIGWVNDECIIDNITNDDRYLSNKNYKGVSIVDALEEIDVDSSFNYRSYLANVNGISNYIGSAIQNNKMLELLKMGFLKY